MNPEYPEYVQIGRQRILYRNIKPFTMTWENGVLVATIPFGNGNLRRLFGDDAKTFFLSTGKPLRDLPLESPPIVQPLTEPTVTVGEEYETLLIDEEPTDDDDPEL